MKFEISSDAPMPEHRASKSEFTTTCQLLEVGQSFFVPGMDVGKVSSSTAPLRPKRFSGITVEEGGKQGIRVWRVR